MTDPSPFAARHPRTGLIVASWSSLFLAKGLPVVATKKTKKKKKTSRRRRSRG